MKYRLRLQDTDGQEEVLYYDPSTSQLTDVEGVRVDLSPIAREYVDEVRFIDREPVTPETPAPKFSAPKLLKIQLGLGCNYHCSYCCQAGHQEEDVRSSSHDVEAFLGKLAILAPPEKVEFWGGEPLLYWKKLQPLVEALRARWPDTRMSIITNGTLLTKERVDFLTRHAVRVTISHDGPGQYLRGEDPFDDPDWVELVRYLYDTGELAINMVITAANPDPAAGVDWIRSRLARPVQVNVESIVNVHDENAPTLTDEKLREISQNLFMGMVTGRLDDSPVLNWKLAHFYKTLALGMPLAAAGQKCGMDRPDYLAVDLLGNVLTCQNTGANGPHWLGTLDDLQAVRLDTATGHQARAACRDCLVAHLCYGACMYLNGSTFAQTCRNEYAANLGVLQAALYFLRRKVLVEATPASEGAARPRYIPIVEVK